MLQWSYVNTWRIHQYYISIIKLIIQVEIGYIIQYYLKKLLTLQPILFSYLLK